MTKEVNENKNFAKLRQVYNSLILATWYKKKIKDSILSQVYADKNKVAGVNIDDPQEKEGIYRKYLRAFKKGVYNYIKEEINPVTQEIIPRKYFSGGFELNVGPHITNATVSQAMTAIETFAATDHAMEVTSQINGAGPTVGQSAKAVTGDRAMIKSKDEDALLWGQFTQSAPDLRNRNLDAPELIKTLMTVTKSSEKLEYYNFRYKNINRNILRLILKGQELQALDWITEFETFQENAYLEGALELQFQRVLALAHLGQIETAAKELSDWSRKLKSLQYAGEVEDHCLSYYRMAVQLMHDKTEIGYKNARVFTMPIMGYEPVSLSGYIRMAGIYHDLGLYGKAKEELDIYYSRPGADHNDSDTRGLYDELVNDIATKGLESITGSDGNAQTAFPHRYLQDQAMVVEDGVMTNNLELYRYETLGKRLKFFAVEKKLSLDAQFLPEAGHGGNTYLFKLDENTVIRVGKVLPELGVSLQEHRGAYHVFQSLGELGISPKVLAEGRTENGFHYLVVEYIDGRNLSSLENNASPAIVNAVIDLMDLLIKHSIINENLFLSSIVYSDKRKRAYLVDGKDSVFDKRSSLSTALYYRYLLFMNFKGRFDPDNNIISHLDKIIIRGTIGNLKKRNRFKFSQFRQWLGESDDIRPFRAKEFLEIFQRSYPGFIEKIDGKDEWVVRNNLEDFAMANMADAEMKSDPNSLSRREFFANLKRALPALVAASVGAIPVVKSLQPGPVRGRLPISLTMQQFQDAARKMVKGFYEAYAETLRSFNKEPRFSLETVQGRTIVVKKSINGLAGGVISGSLLFGGLMNLRSAWKDRTINRRDSILSLAVGLFQLFMGYSFFAAADGDLYSAPAGSGIILSYESSFNWDGSLAQDTFINVAHEVAHVLSLPGNMLLASGYGYLAACLVAGKTNFPYVDTWGLRGLAKAALESGLDLRQREAIIRKIYTNEDLYWDYLAGAVTESMLEEKISGARLSCSGKDVFQWLDENGYFKERSGAERHLKDYFDHKDLFEKALRNKFGPESRKIFEILDDNGNRTDAKTSFKAVGRELEPGDYRFPNTLIPDGMRSGWEYKYSAAIAVMLLQETGSPQKALQAVYRIGQLAREGSEIPPGKDFLKGLGLDLKGNETSQATGSEKTKGGIDLTPANMNLQTQNNGGEIKFHLDPAMLEQLHNVPGFVPVIINIRPMNNIREFLGIPG